MSEKKPTPILTERSRTCPVCGKRSYSAAGIHPQCAVQRSDALRREKLRAASPPPAPSVPRQRSWDKKCPKCEAVVHVRLKACACGYCWPTK